MKNKDTELLIQVYKSTNPDDWADYNVVLIDGSDVYRVNDFTDCPEDAKICRDLFSGMDLANIISDYFEVFKASSHVTVEEITLDWAEFHEKFLI